MKVSSAALSERHDTTTMHTHLSKWITENAENAYNADRICTLLFALMAISAFATMFVPPLHYLSLHGASSVSKRHRPPLPQSLPQIHSKLLPPIYTILDLRISKRYFTLFYIIPFFLPPLRPTHLHTTLFQLHCLRRLYECARVHNFRGQMTLTGFLVGCVHYVITSGETLGGSFVGIVASRYNQLRPTL